MRISTCRNSSIPPFVHFETFSTALARRFTGTLGQFSRAALVQVSPPVGVGHGVLCTCDAMPVPLCTVGRTGHRMGLQHGEIFSSLQSHTIRLSPEGQD
jgi:hypothetical protein